jgi:hypothetical protein
MAAGTIFSYSSRYNPAFILKSLSFISGYNYETINEEKNVFENCGKPRKPKF